MYPEFVLVLIEKGYKLLKLENHYTTIKIIHELKTIVLC